MARLKPSVGLQLYCNGDSTSISFGANSSKPSTEDALRTLMDPGNTVADADPGTYK
jgi:hypothetical protein